MDFWNPVYAVDDMVLHRIMILRQQRVRMICDWVRNYEAQGHAFLEPIYAINIMVLQQYLGDIKKKEAE